MTDLNPHLLAAREAKASALVEALRSAGATADLLVPTSLEPDEVAAVEKLWADAEAAAGVHPASHATRGLVRVLLKAAERAEANRPADVFSGF